MTHQNLTCAELDERLGDYLAGALDPSSAAEIELHVSGCASCSALLRDFERITRQAATRPPLAPSHDLWPAIAQRLDAPVADLGAFAAARTVRQAKQAGPLPSAWRRLRVGAAAAGLVGITALATYVATSREPASTVAVAPASDSVRPAPVTESPARDEASPLPSFAAPAAPTYSGAPPVLAAAPGSAPERAAAVRVSETLPVRATFNTEIEALRGIVTQRREELDPRTIAILETSLSTIDSAIAEARRALVSDPASRFLSSQLDKALEKKLGLLRTAALLPSRT